MSAERASTQPEPTKQELQEKLEEACNIFMDADAEIRTIEKSIDTLKSRRARAWKTFNHLKHVIEAQR